MDNHIIICLCLSFVLGVFGKDLRIVGGQSADSSQFPYLVSFKLITINKHVCGGSIISAKFLLSAAHCIYGKTEYLHLIKAYTGLTNVSNLSGTAYSIDSVFIHPDFVGDQLGKDGFHNDIVVVKIKGFICLNSLQKIIELPNSPISTGTEVTLCGWGLTYYPSNVYPTTLYHVSVKVIDFQECARLFTFPILQDQICTHKQRAGGCIGDSGGPVVKNGKIVGIISFSVPCATHVPDIHTDVYTHLNFIKSIIKNN